MSRLRDRTDGRPRFRDRPSALSLVDRIRMANYQTVPTALMSERWPLAGIRILDAGSGIASSYTTKLLADAGADVVKVEPPAGDPLRTDSSLFDYLHTSKQSVIIASEDQSRLAELVRWADLVVVDDSEAAVGTGLDPVMSVRAVEAGVCVVALSWFGMQGPWAGRRANEFTLQAWCGSTASRGRKHETPMAAGGVLGEWAAGAAAGVAGVALLRAARLSGRAGYVDISVFEAMTIAFNQFQAVAAQLDGRGPEPVPVPRLVDVPSISPAKDGWIGYATVRPAHFASFAEMVGHPEWVEDSELKRFDRRPDHDAYLGPIIDAWTSQRTVTELLSEAGARHVPVAPLGNGATLLEIDYFRERGVFVDHPGGRFRQPRIPYRSEAYALRPFEPAPGLGAQSNVSFPPRQPRPQPHIENGDDADLLATRPCAGLRVFDLTSTWAGPYASQILGFLGADVIKVESIQRPDGTRLSTAYATVGEQPWEHAPILQSVNTTKRGLTLDLSRPAGQALGRRLLATCDILIENFTPRVLQSFGLIDDEFLERNPGLIVVRMPAWGLDGSWSERPGFAQTMEQVSGLAWVTGRADGPPMILRGPCDPLGGWHATLAVLSALEVRERTGRGTILEVPLVEGALNVAAAQLTQFTASGEISHRMGNRSSTAAPQNLYRTNEPEHWLALSVETDEQWLALGCALGEPLWVKDPKLGSFAGRSNHEDLIDRELQALFEQRGLDELVELLWSAGVPTAPVVNARAVAENEQHVARDFYERVQHRVVGDLRVPRFPGLWAGRRERWHWRPAPTLGQDNEALLAEIGCDAQEIEQLASEGIIGTEPI